MTDVPPCWSIGASVVGTGPRPSTVRTLADLASREGARRRAGGRVDPEQRSAALLPLHATVALLEPVVLAPWTVDRLLVSVEPDQVGWAGDRSTGDVWVGAHGIARSGDPAAWLGRRVAHLLDPVIEAVAPEAGVTVRAARLVAYDALRSTAARLARAEASGLPPEWAEELVAACGHTPRIQGTTIRVRADDGPAVELPVPRTCCVLAARPPADACPTCPLHPDDDDRSARSAAWLAELDDDEFAAVVGRPRRHQQERD